MKKVLLTMCAALMAMSASAAVDNMLESWNSDFENGNTGGWSKYFQNGAEGTLDVAQPGYNSEYCLVTDVTAAGDDYYTANVFYDFETPLEPGEYSFSFYAKSSVAGNKMQVYYQNNKDYSGGGYSEFELTEEWAQYSAIFKITTDGNNRINFGFGKFVGEYYVDDIVFGKVVEDNTPVAGVPDNYEVIISGNQTGWNTPITAWQDNFSNVTEDGRPCIKFTNATAGDGYSIQLRIDYDYAPDTEYYITFDLKGDVSDVENSLWFQYIDEDNGVYDTMGGYNTFDTFKVTSDTEWTPVIVKGEYAIGDSTHEIANRVAVNLGAYVGTLYMTNIKVWAPEKSVNDGVENVAVDANAPAVYYNLQGVKVANPENGIFIRVQGNKATKVLF